MYNVVVKCTFHERSQYLFFFQEITALLFLGFSSSSFFFGSFVFPTLCDLSNIYRFNLSMRSLLASCRDSSTGTRKRRSPRRLRPCQWRSRTHSKRERLKKRNVLWLSLCVSAFLYFCLSVSPSLCLYVSVSVSRSLSLPPSSLSHYLPTEALVHRVERLADLLIVRLAHNLHERGGEVWRQTVSQHRLDKDANALYVRPRGET